MFEEIKEEQIKPGEIEEVKSGETKGPGSGRPRQKPARRPVFADKPTPARRVAEGAMLVATAVIFGLSAAYLPVVWLAAMFLWPVPLALLVRRFGTGFGLMGMAMTAVLLSLFIGPVGALTMLLNMGGVGFWYGYAARRGIRPTLAVLGGVVLAAVSALSLIVFSSAVAGLQIGDLAVQVEKLVEMYIGNLEKRGQLTAVIGTLSVEEYTALLTEHVLSMLPASLLMIAMFEAGVSYALNAYIFRRLGYPVAKLPPFYEWRMPWYTMWGLIIALGCGIWAMHTGENGVCSVIATNVMYIYQPLLMMSGLTLVYWQAWFWRMPWMNYMMLLMVVFAFRVVSPALIMLGLFDSMMNLRAAVQRRYRPGGRPK